MLAKAKSGAVTPSVGSDDSELGLHAAVREAYGKRDKSILTSFLAQIREAYDDSSELAEFANQQDKLGNTALHTCMMLYEQDQRRADAQYSKDKNEKAFGLLHMENAAFAILMRDALFKAGIDPNKTNLQGKTAIELCYKDNAKTIIEVEKEAAKKMEQRHASEQKARAEGSSKSNCIIL